MPTVKIKIDVSRKEELLTDGYKIPAVFDSDISSESSFEAPLYMNGSIIYGSRVSVGAFTSIAGGKFGNVTIGRYCAIGEQVAIGQHEHPTSFLTSSRISHVPNMHGWKEIASREDPRREFFKLTPFTASNPTTRIGNDVWIGYGAYVRAGVTIGDGAIVAACSVVTKDVPPFSIVAGVPAKVVKMRFPQDTIEAIIDVKWWEYCLYDISADLSKPELSLKVLKKNIDDGSVKPYDGKTMSASQIIKV